MVDARGERDLDHIILAAVRGLDRASLEYPQVDAGLILMMDRTFTARQNEVIVEKAIRWSSRGIVGVWIGLDVHIAARLALLGHRFVGRRWAVVGWG